MLGIGGLAPINRNQRPYMNLLRHNEDFAPAIWTPHGCSIVAAAGNVPADGPTSASAQLKEDGSNGQHYIEAAVAANWSLGTVLSIYAKAGTRGWLELYMLAGTSGKDVDVFFNLATGAVGTISSPSGAPAGRCAEARLLTGGFCHCLVLMAHTLVPGETLTIDVQAATADATDSFQGTNGNVSLQLNGAVLEPLTSYYRT